MSSLKHDSLAFQKLLFGMENIRWKNKPNFIDDDGVYDHEGEGE